MQVGASTRAVVVAGGDPAPLRAPEHYRVHAPIVVGAGALRAGGSLEHPRADRCRWRSRVPSGLERHRIHPAVRSRRATCAPVAASNTRALPSLPVATQAPSGQNARPIARPRRGPGGRSCAPGNRVEYRTPPSLLVPVAVGPVRAERHRMAPPSWSTWAVSAPVAASNTRALPSPLPVADPGPVRAQHYRVAVVLGGRSVRRWLCSNTRAPPSLPGAGWRSGPRPCFP